MSLESWNAHYANGHTPWDSGVPDPHLRELVPTLPIRRALAIGCGTGTNALWMAAQGLDVTAVDLAPLALERACQKAATVARPPRFHHADVLVDPLGGPYDFVYDRGCFHAFDDPPAQARFAAQVAAHLVQGGHWLSIIGSTEGPSRRGPPSRSVRDIAQAVEPFLEILSLSAAWFPEHGATAWRLLVRRRLQPAHASTLRETLR